MTRRRFIQIDGELVEVGLDFIPEPRRTGDATLWNDRVYQDAGDKRFRSRSQHREYMKRNNVTTVDDFKDTWREAEKQRIASKAGFDPTRKQDVINSFNQLQRGRK